MDTAVARLLHLVARTRATVPETSSPRGSGPTAPDGRPLLRELAARAVVLLRNNGVLPLHGDRLGSLAVLGPQADRPDVQGRGSSHVDPSYVVTPLDGLARRARRGRDDTVMVCHEPGVVRRPPEPLGCRELRVPEGAVEGDPPGLLVEHYAAGDGYVVEGEPFHAEVVAETRLFWVGRPTDRTPERFAVRGTAWFTPDETGTWHFRVCSAGRSRVLLDDELVVDNMAPTRGNSFFGRGSTEVRGTAELVAGQTYRLVVELFGNARYATTVSGIDLGVQPPDRPDARKRAVEAAAAADVAVVVVGNERADAEGADRRSLDLPADQVALVRAVAAVNPATVVLLNTGAPVTTDWADDVAAVAQVWYPGQEAGDAIADVLFGDVEATGRLPTTFPRRIEDTPAHRSYPGTAGHARYAEGVFVGYRHYDSHGVEPRFGFGHGLSYTEFHYGELDVVPLASGADGPRFEVAVDVTNVGERRGSEVVQVYVHDVAATVRRPDQELRQFARVELDPGETATVRLALEPRAFAFWDGTRHDWLIEPGTFEIRVGSSSRQIHRTGRVEVT